MGQAPLRARHASESESLSCFHSILLPSTHSFPIVVSSYRMSFPRVATIIDSLNPISSHLDTIHPSPCTRTNPHSPIPPPPTRAQEIVLSPLSDSFFATAMFQNWGEVATRVHELVTSYARQNKQNSKMDSFGAVRRRESAILRLLWIQERFLFVFLLVILKIKYFVCMVFHRSYSVFTCPLHPLNYFYTFSLLSFSRCRVRCLRCLCAPPPAPRPAARGHQEIRGRLPAVSRAADQRVQTYGVGRRNQSQNRRASSARGACVGACGW
jgi:hypothetical protein